MRASLPPIRHDRTGYSALTELVRQTQGVTFDQIDIDLSESTWFDGDMCAAFGAILYRLGRNVNSVGLLNISTEVEKCLSRNGFLSSYGRHLIPDNYGSAIPYKRFDVGDDHAFQNYVERELMQRKNMPDMSAGLTKKFSESVFEVFNNAIIHSQTQLGIFTCGQFYPRQNRIAFSIADLGIGIRNNVEREIGLKLKADEAIKWALTAGATTKTGPIPGGLGLKLLREFVHLNKGRLQIVSECGYWELSHQREDMGLLQYPFPGTVVNIEVNTADSHQYKLSSERPPVDIF